MFSSKLKELENVTFKLETEINEFYERQDNLNTVQSYGPYLTRVTAETAIWK